MGNPIQITTNQSDPPTTKTHKNNTYNLRKDSNNSNSDSKYDRLSLKDWEIYTPRKKHLTLVSIVATVVHYHLQQKVLS